MNWRRLCAVVLKEFRQLRRDRATLAMIIVIPIMELVLFGYAINLNVRELHAAVLDQSDTSGSRAVVMDILATGVIGDLRDGRSPEEVMRMLRAGEISVGIMIPHDFERRLLDGREAVQLLVDGSEVSVQNAVIQLARMPLNYQSSVSNVIPMSNSEQISVVSFYNPQRSSAVSIVPGLIGVILTMTMVLLASVAIVRERERSNMELLITMPVTRTELMIGKVLPYVAVGLLQMSIVLLLGQLLFDVSIRGHLLDVYIAAILLIMANLTLGLFISTCATSQLQAMQMSFFVFLPSILLSGFMFPFSGMPPVVQWGAEMLPLTHFIRLIRGISLRGANLSEMLVDVVALLIITVVMMSAAVLRFRKRLD